MADIVATDNIYHAFFKNSVNLAEAPDQDSIALAEEMLITLELNSVQNEFTEGLSNRFNSLRKKAINVSYIGISSAN